LQTNNLNEQTIIEPHDCKIENDEITSKIENIVYNYYLPKNESIENEKADLFLYSIGGITRKSVQLSNNIYELFHQWYKKYINKQSEQIHRKNFNAWIKNNFNIESFCEFYSINNEYSINSYLINQDEETIEKLMDLIKDFLTLYTKCILSTPIVEVEFEFEHTNKFDGKNMKVIINTGKNVKSVNFCYLPKLKSNGNIIPGGYYNVFTFIESKTFKRKINKL
jgi:hypothetical protein